MYEVTTKYETRKINGKYYILSGLNKEIGLYPSLPIDFLLMRNESFEKFEEDGVLLKVENVLAEEKYLNLDGTIRLDEAGIIAYDPFT